MDPSGQFPRRAHAADPGCRELHHVGQARRAPSVVRRYRHFAYRHHAAVPLSDDRGDHILVDHAVSFRVLPISAEETAVTATWLVQDAVEACRQSSTTHAVWNMAQ